MHDLIVNYSRIKEEHLYSLQLADLNAALLSCIEKVIFTHGGMIYAPRVCSYILQAYTDFGSIIDGLYDMPTDGLLNRVFIECLMGTQFLLCNREYYCRERTYINAT